MAELSKDLKVQIITNRRLSVARNIFELEVDIVVMESQGRAEEIEVLKNKIEELRVTDLSLQEFMATL